MTTEPQGLGSQPAQGSQFADLVEALTRRMQAGEAVDSKALLAEYPEHADRLGPLLPTLEAMAALREVADPSLTRDMPGSFESLMCRVSARLEAGEEIDLDRLIAEAPEHIERLRSVVPTLAAVAQLGRQARDAGWAAGMSDAVDAEQRRVLGDFKILREVGRGGMGVVYEAEQISLARRVALKMLPFAAIMDPRQLARFRNEAQAAAQLQHQHIVPIYAVGCERGVHFYAMQFVDGQTLAEVICDLQKRTKGAAQHATGKDSQTESSDNKTGEWRDSNSPPSPSAGSSREMDSKTLGPSQGAAGGGAQPAAQADTVRAALSTLRSGRRGEFFRTIARLGIQASEALEHAHENGVLHRDIKPANLMLDARGNLWVTDFGLARLETDANLTVTGDVLGTLRYMSPEQASGKPTAVDQRTDIYSLGATLYEVLALKPAFDGHDRRELLNRIATDEPKPLRTIDTAIPVELETIVGKAMSKEQVERYATAGELAADLRRFLDEVPIHARPPSLPDRVRKWTRRHPTRILAAMAMLVVLLIGAGVGLAIVAHERNKTAIALDDAEKNLETADAERRRAEDNLGLAAEAVEHLLSRIGGDQLGHGQFEHAEDFLKDAVAFYDKLLQQDHSPEVKYGATVAHRRLADAQRSRAAYAESVQSLRVAMMMLEALHKAAPANRKYELDLATCQNELGMTLWHARDLPAAEAAYDRSLALGRKLLAREPRNVAYLDGVDGTLNNLAVLYWFTGKNQRAEATYRQLLESWDQLPTGVKNTAAQQSSRAGTQSNLATLLSYQGKFQEAEELLRDAITRQTVASAVEPNNRQYREFLYNHHWDLANNHMGQRQYIEAAEVALKLPQLDPKQKFKAYSEAADTLVRCATQLDRRANSEAGQLAESTATDKDKAEAKDRAAAETYRQQAHELIKKALQAEDGQPEDLNRLAWFLATCDDLRFRDPSQSVTLARKFVQDRPQVARFWTTLGAAHYRAGDDREALKALRKADEMGPNDFVVETDLFLALTHQRSSAPDEAKRYFDRGIARMDTNEHGRDTTNDEDLKTLRQEAAQALRIDEAPPAPVESFG